MPEIANLFDHSSIDISLRVEFVSGSDLDNRRAAAAVFAMCNAIGAHNIVDVRVDRPPCSPDEIVLTPLREVCPRLARFELNSCDLLILSGVPHWLRFGASKEVVCQIKVADPSAILPDDIFLESLLLPLAGICQTLHISDLPHDLLGGDAVPNFAPARVFYPSSGIASSYCAAWPYLQSFLTPNLQRLRTHDEDGSILYDIIDYIEAGLQNLPNLQHLHIDQSGGFDEVDLSDEYGRLTEQCRQRRCNLRCSLSLSIRRQDSAKLEQLLAIVREGIVELRLSLWAPVTCGFSMRFSRLRHLTLDTDYVDDLDSGIDNWASDDSLARIIDQIMAPNLRTLELWLYPMSARYLGMLHSILYLKKFPELTECTTRHRTKFDTGSMNQAVNKLANSVKQIGEVKWTRLPLR